MVEARHFMAVGAYPLQRMTSIYAFLLSLGAPTSVAAALHGAVAVAVLAWAAWTIRTTENPRVQIGVAATASAFVSPYFYDYDQTIFAVGLMLLAPTLSRALAPRAYGLVLFSIAVGQALGIALGVLETKISLGGPVILAAYVVILRAIHLDRVRTHEAGPEVEVLGSAA